MAGRSAHVHKNKSGGGVRRRPRKFTMHRVRRHTMWPGSLEGQMWRIRVCDTVLSQSRHCWQYISPVVQPVNLVVEDAIRVLCVAEQS